MFNLESAITAWRHSLAACIKKSGHLDELENHLREDLAKKIQTGLPPRQAFESAVENLGRREDLVAEFRKTAAARAARLRRRSRFASAGIFAAYALGLIFILLKKDLSFDERLAGFAAVATLLAAWFFVWQILPRHVPTIPGKATQSAIGILGGISGMAWFMIFARVILPHCNFTPGQLLVTVLWATVPMIVLPMIGFMIIDQSERYQQLG